MGEPSSSDKMRAATAAARVSSPGLARILVVEDEESLGRALLRFLRGYELVYCRSVAEALGQIRAGEHFDVVVSDMMMPGGNGSDLHAALCVEAPDLAGRTIFMTGGATTPETLAFVADHAASVVTKPLDLASLRRRVDELLSTRGLRFRGPQR